MISKPCLLDWTILDLSDETYYSKDGYVFQRIKTFSLSYDITEFVVVCLNANRCDNLRTHDIILEDYRAFKVQTLRSEARVQDLLNLCRQQNNPIVMSITEYREKDIIIATCHEPWIAWLKFVFGNYEIDETMLNELKRDILSRLLASLRK